MLIVFILQIKNHLTMASKISVEMAGLNPRPGNADQLNLQGVD
jgi:hypothetical protein